MLRRAVHGAAAAAAAAVGGFASTHCEPPPSPRGPRHDTQLSALDKAPRAIVLSVLDGSCALWDAAGLERRSCSALRSRLLNAVLLSGSTNPALAEEVGYESGLAVGQVAVSTFADGEVGVKILESVRGKDVFVLQSATPPINDSIMETLLIVSAARRASARSVTLISPSLPYGQDVGTVASLGHLVRHGIIADGTDGGGTVDALEGEGTTVLDGGAIAGLQAGVRLGGDDAAAVARALAAQVRAAEVAAEAAEARLAATHSALGGWGSDGAAAGEGRAATTRSAVSPIAASDVAKLFTSAGVDRLLSVDIAPPGSSQLEGFFPPHVPVESLRSARICCDALARLGLKNVTIVAPHEDVIQLATEFRTGLAERCAEGEDVGLAVIVGKQTGGLRCAVFAVVLQERRCWFGWHTFQGTLACSHASPPPPPPLPLQRRDHRVATATVRRSRATSACFTSLATLRGATLCSQTWSSTLPRRCVTACRCSRPMARGASSPSRRTRSLAARRCSGSTAPRSSSSSSPTRSPCASRTRATRTRSCSSPLRRLSPALSCACRRTCRYRRCAPRAMFQRSRCLACRTCDTAGRSR